VSCLESSAATESCWAWSMDLITRPGPYAVRMSLLAITHHDGIRIAEIGFLLEVLAGVLLAIGSAAPTAKRSVNLGGGIALAAGGVLLIIAAHWGRFG
jgi:hypothetical protein